MRLDLGLLTMRTPLEPPPTALDDSRKRADGGPYYTVLMFETRARALAFCREATTRLKRVDAVREGSSAMLWIAATEFRDGSFYIYATDHALDAAVAAGAEFSIAGYIDHAGLPRARCLVAEQAD